MDFPWLVADLCTDNKISTYSIALCGGIQKKNIPESSFLQTAPPGRPVSQISHLSCVSLFSNVHAAQFQLEFCLVRILKFNVSNKKKLLVRKRNYDLTCCGFSGWPSKSIVAAPMSDDGSVETCDWLAFGKPKKMVWSLDVLGTVELTELVADLPLDLTATAGGTENDIISLWAATSGRCA